MDLYIGHYLLWGKALHFQLLYIVVKKLVWKYENALYHFFFFL